MPPVVYYVVCACGRHTHTHTHTHTWCTHYTTLTNCLVIASRMHAICTRHMTHTGTHTDTQTHRHADTQTYRHTDTHMHTCT